MRLRFFVGPGLGWTFCLFVAALAFFVLVPLVGAAGALAFPPPPPLLRLRLRLPTGAYASLLRCLLHVIFPALGASPLRLILCYALHELGRELVRLNLACFSMKFAILPFTSQTVI